MTVTFSAVHGMTLASWIYWPLFSPALSYALAADHASPALVVQMQFTSMAMFCFSAVLAAQANIKGLVGSRQVSRRS